MIALMIMVTMGCKSPTEDSGPKKEEVYVASDFTGEHLFTNGIEGPAFVDGLLYAVNFDTQGTIGVIDPAGRCSLFVTLPEGSIGNGIRCNDLGDLFVADYTKHNILKIDRSSRNIEIYAHSDLMNQPNDLAIRSDGTLFASDPNWKESTGQLWRINTDGSVHLLEQNMGTCNGIEVSFDEKHLYVNESVQRNVWKYDLSDDGSISNKMLFHQFIDYGMDGMRCDNQGNLFITRHGKGTVAILDKEGTLIQEVIFQGKKPSNIAFGGKDGRTCYVTMQDRGAFEQFKSEHPGRCYHLQMRN
ncbi:MAG: SMP-30/gluconolactonase/LRE family protein [Saprospiraceae bacterium]|nr:SMP-30/gluconolactonase/LRE family protein [Saprospiraceae bacterium]